MQNKPIETLLEAWLTFLSEDDPHRLGELFEAFPDFIAMDDEIKHLEEVKHQLEGDKARLETQNIQYQAKINELLAEVQRLKANPS